MKATKFWQLFTVLGIVIGAALFTACDTTPSECDGVECLNGGECVVNDVTALAECSCPPGYSGVACEDFDNCFDIICPDNAECEDGVCYCNVGFEGANCDTLIRDKYIGTYSAEDICPSGTFASTAVITGSATNNLWFTVSNFGGFENLVNCEVVDQYSFRIPNQEDAAGRIFEGVDANGSEILGVFDPALNVVAGTYTVSFSDGTSETCDFVWTLQ